MLVKMGFSRFALLTMLFNVELCYSTKASISFTDTLMFTDISYYNFGANVYKDNQQEYVITARAGQKVSLYLFGSDYFYLTVFDGANGSSPIISTEPYQSATDKMLTVPMNITSTGQNMFLRINVTSMPTFSAVVTDYMHSDNCRSPVLSLNRDGLSTNNYVFQQNNASGCYYAIHAIQHFETLCHNIVSSNKQLDQIDVYKGLQMDQKHFLRTTNQMEYIAVYDDWVLIHPKKTVSLQVGYTLPVGNRTLAVLYKTENTIMSNDYLNIITDSDSEDHDSGNGELIVLDLMPPVTSVQISYLNLLGNSSIVITTATRGLPVSKPVTYSANQFKGAFNVTYTCDQVQILYLVPDLTVIGTDGFYGIYRDATIYPIDNITSLPPTTLQTTTNKGAANLALNVLLTTFIICFIL